MKQLQPLKLRTLAALFAVAVLTITQIPAHAATTNFWSSAGTTVGALGATPTSSTWDTTSITNWGAIAGPFNVAWANANNDTAVFTNALATATTKGSTVELTTGISAGGLQFLDTGFNRLDGYKVTNNTITLPANASIFVDSATNGLGQYCEGSTISSVITGSGTLNKTGNGVLALPAVNTFTGTVAIAQGYLAVGDWRTTGVEALPNVTNITIANGATLGAYGSNVVVSARINLSGGATVGIASPIWPPNNGGTGLNKIFSISGGIHGNGNVIFKSVTGFNTFPIIDVGVSDYTGTTTITTSSELNNGNNSGSSVLRVEGTSYSAAANSYYNGSTVVRLKANNALPVTTVVSIEGFAGASAYRTCDLYLNGFNQTLAGLTNVPPSVPVTGNRIQRVINDGAQCVLTISNTIDYGFSGQLGGIGGSVVNSYQTGQKWNNFSLVKAGSGTFTILPPVISIMTNSYNGGTTINGGTLLVNNTASGTSGTGTGAVNINSGGTLGGKGYITGLVTNNAGGTLAPGTNGVGTLTLNGGVVLNAGSTNAFVVDGSTPANNSVALGGSVTYGGILKIVSSGIFTNGQTFTLFSGVGAASASQFSSVVGSPGSGQGFTFTNGVLTVVAAGPSGTGTITNSYSGGVLSLTWPTGQGWRLQSQTNSLTAGLSTNWTYVTDGSVSSTNIPVNSAQPAVFYRLTYP